MKMKLSLNELDSKRSRDLIPLECLQCGSVHYRTKNIVQRILNGDKQNTLSGCFCSNDCKVNYRRQNVKVHCKFCNKEIQRCPSSIRSEFVFCTHSCSAKFFNKNRMIFKKCLNCQKYYRPYKGSKVMKYCSRKCQQDYQRKMIYQKIEMGLYKSSHPGNKMLKNYFIKKRGHKCEQCQNDRWLNNPIILTIHHIDGDSTNNIPENIQLLCWNCHSMTDNYGIKNKNSTRNYRYYKIRARSQNRTDFSSIPVKNNTNILYGH